MADERLIAALDFHTMEMSRRSSIRWEIAYPIIKSAWSFSTASVATW